MSTRAISKKHERRPRCNPPGKFLVHGDDPWLYGFRRQPAEITIDTRGDCSVPDDRRSLDFYCLSPSWPLPEVLPVEQQDVRNLVDSTRSRWERNERHFVLCWGRHIFDGWLSAHHLFEGQRAMTNSQHLYGVRPLCD
jgi:hypothetical protein